MGRKLEIEWQETASELKRRYREERNSERRTRLHAFWQLHCGKSMKAVAGWVGIAYRTLQYWVAWYRHGGLTEVLARIRGHGCQGRPGKLQALQQRALAAKVALGAFRTIWDAIQWVQGRWQVDYSYDGLYKRLKGLNCRPKVPRPRSIRADVNVQDQWRTDGLLAALQQAEISPIHAVRFSDEMRFGLWCIVFLH